MNEALVILCIAETLAIGMLLLMLRGITKDMRQIATEAILASRAQNAEELAHAQVTVHQAQADREAPKPAEDRPGFANLNADPGPQIMGKDGRILQALRPL